MKVCLTGLMITYADDNVPAKSSETSNQRLGPAGLSLHYANIIIQIDTLVSVYKTSFSVYPLCATCQTSFKIYTS